MKRLTSLLLLAMCLVGCRSTRQPEPLTGSSTKLLTYNVNWGGAGADKVAAIIRDAKAEIVCLQETTPEWKTFLKDATSADYRFASFRQSKGRMGGGLAFLSKLPAREVAYIPSETGWFDGWIMEFTTPSGPVQVLNVHLRPPVSDRGGWVSGYFNTRDDRVAEIQKFIQYAKPNLPLIVAGDFNDSERSAVVDYLRKRGLSNALPQFDRSTATWRWQYRGITLKRRMDHIMYSAELYCSGAQVLEAGPSDHFPVLAWFRPR